jgi:hypothetical protein
VVFEQLSYYWTQKDKEARAVELHYYWKQKDKEARVAK